ncbi:unnamed protein product [Adineta ricciae]|uniref:Uncharacterized protein n=1 Tax=Adineta ricciae TaxID=249248 RepID=A0A814A8V3_ADIRI|nr:unnamed protein product [Adineta ricciae]CAF1345683.1 unnamed protein product [Adineta ricciae]
MAAATAIKPGPIENRTTLFRTQMVNGKPQIYFEEIGSLAEMLVSFPLSSMYLLDEPQEKPQTKTKRNSRAVNTIRVPEQPKPKQTVQKPAPISQSVPTKQPKKTHKIVVNDKDASVGVFMTMEEIAELVKAVKDTSRASENQEILLPPPLPPQPQPQPVLSQPDLLPSPPQQQQQQQQQSNNAPVPPLDLPPHSNTVLPLGQISPRDEGLGMMADKKRKKWMRERAEMDRMRLEVEYDQLKHQLSSMNQNTSTSPERIVYPSDFSSTNKQTIMPTGKPADNPTNDYARTGLVEKKQQQWRQENAEKAPAWNPFGRPGAGAPNLNEVDQRISQLPTNVVVPYRVPDPPSVTSNIVINDQSRVPAAMRTNLLLGDVRFEDDVKVAKEIERRQWLGDLQKQIEENKRKKFTEQETERRQDFLHENVQPIVQEAANRHNQHQQPKDSSPTPFTNTSTANPNPQESSKSRQHDTLVQQTYEKIVEAAELAKYEKKQQLIEKLKRNGHKTDLLAKTLPEMKTPIPQPTQRTTDRYQDASPKRTTTTAAAAKVEPLHLNTVNDYQQSYRTNDARRDEAVNTIDSTFRSDNGVQTDLRMIPQNQMFHYTREESDLPPQVPNHLIREGKQTKKNVRIRSQEDHQRQRRSSVTTTHSKANSQDENTYRNPYGPHDLVHRPLWNYQNPGHREYVPNSKRDPNYEKRHHPKQAGNERTTIDRNDDIQKRTAYNRWNSDSELQHKRKESKAPSQNQPRSIISKHIQSHSQQQEPANIPRGTNKEKTFALMNNEDDSSFRNIPTLDKYEHFIPYTRSDEILDPARAFSPLPQSRESSAHVQRSKPTTYTNDDHHHHRRPNVNVQQPPYHVPPSQQQHILQQLTAIKENLVRRQQEVATSMNAIPV